MVQPEKKFKAGAVTASVFANEIETRSGKASVKSVSLQRAYKDRDGNFQNTASLRANDIQKAVLVLGKAYEYLVMGEEQDAP